MFWLMALIFFFIPFLYFSITTYVYGNDDYWPKLGVPFGEGKELGTFWERISFRMPFHEMDNTFYKKFKKLSPPPKLGGIMEFRQPVAFIMDPDLIKTILVKDFDHFMDRRVFGKKNDPTLFDKFLFNMNNPDWKDMRATLTPTFTTGKIKRMFNIFTESAEKMTNFLKTEVEMNPEQIDVRDVAGRYTMDVIASIAFGVDSKNFEDKNSSFASIGFRFQTQFSSWRGMFKMFVSIMLPSFVLALLPISSLDTTAFKYFRSIVHTTIKYRESTGERRNDFLQLLMDNRAERSAAADEDQLETENNGADVILQKATKIQLTDELILAQCMVFFLAGFDGAETQFIFTAYELALNPDIQKKLAAELKAAVDKNGELDYETVNGLEYLDMVVSETFRKYAVGRLERKCTEDYAVPGMDITLKKGQISIVPIWAMHHDPDLYPDPEKFIPERFTKENKSARHPYTYMPFGMGPRNCIGMRFAITEGKAAIAHLVLSFHLEPSARTTIPMKFKKGLILKPADGMWLKVTPRQNEE